MLGDDEPRRGLVVLLAGLRRAGRARPLRPDRAARARSPSTATGTTARRCRSSTRWPTIVAQPADGRARRRDSVPRKAPGRAAGRSRASAAPSRGTRSSRRTPPGRSNTRRCRSTIRSTSCFRRGRPGCPKCIVHGAGGTLLQHLKEHLLHGDLKAGDRLFYFTTCGWMMWNWLVSGLAAGATLLLYDGSPFIDRGKVLWDFAEAERMTHFGTSAKYIDHAKKIGVVPRKDFALAAPAHAVLDRQSARAGELRLRLPVREERPLPVVDRRRHRHRFLLRARRARRCRCGAASCSAAVWACRSTSTTTTAGRSRRQPGQGRARLHARRSRRCRSASGTTPTTRSTAPPISSAFPASGATATTSS